MEAPSVQEIYRRQIALRAQRAVGVASALSSVDPGMFDRLMSASEKERWESVRDFFRSHRQEIRFIPKGSAREATRFCVLCSDQELQARMVAETAAACAGGGGSFLAIATSVIGELRRPETAGAVNGFMAAALSNHERLPKEFRVWLCHQALAKLAYFSEPWAHELGAELSRLAPKEESGEDAEATSSLFRQLGADSVYCEGALEALAAMGAPMPFAALSFACEALGEREGQDIAADEWVERSVALGFLSSEMAARLVREPAIRLQCRASLEKFLLSGLGSSGRSHGSRSL